MTTVTPAVTTGLDQVTSGSHFQLNSSGILNLSIVRWLPEFLGNWRLLALLSVKARQIAHNCRSVLSIPYQIFIILSSRFFLSSMEYHTGYVWNVCTLVATAFFRCLIFRLPFSDVLVRTPQIWGGGMWGLLFHCCDFCFISACLFNCCDCVCALRISLKTWANTYLCACVCLQLFSSLLIICETWKKSFLVKIFRLFFELNVIYFFSLSLPREWLV